MGNEVFANGNEIACKSGDGKVIAAFPDVCLSPPSPPAGPIPVPYPDTSFSKDMKNGSKKVKINGKEVMLKDKSFYKTSPLGNEAATKSLGAGVVSHVITGKTYFVAWSMDVKFEGQNVDRHIDLTTSNHASPMGDTPIIPNNEGTADKNNECKHINIRRDPKKDISKKEQQDRIEKQKKAAQDKEADIDRLLDEAIIAEAAGNKAQAVEILDKALELDFEFIGKRFENKVAQETNAKEVNITIYCEDKCKNKLGEFDVVTEDGIVKECKNRWRNVSEDQLLKHQALVQRPDVFGPGTIVHLAIPKGKRRSGNKKFKQIDNADEIIQEH